jgi:hypothetical protein
MLMTDTRNLEIAARLRKVASWNDFARTILSDLDRGRYVNANQMLAAERMMDKLDARPQDQTVDLSPIRKMFEAAVASGLKRPAYRALGLKITLAPATGVNAGALYVVTETDDTYQGKIVDVTFKATRGGDVHNKLLQIAQNPLEIAIEYGRKTGRCACCGKELTNAESISLGIGPICKKKWSL